MEMMLEVEGMHVPPLPNGGANLAAFASFAVSRGFGAVHPLISLAEHLQAEHRVALGPLTTFYDADIEDAEDAEKLELAWQPAAELEASIRAVATALQTDATCAVFARRGNADGLAAELEAMHGPLEHAARAGRRVRLSYRL
jgi:hypothetical protein